MKELRGKNAIVTGASRGLGVYIAKTLAQHGVNLALVARSADKLEDTRRICEATGVRVIAIAADVTSLEDQRRLVATAEREFGAVDILVNNAGIELVSAFKDLSIEQIDDVIRTNLSAPIWLTKLVLPSMLSRKSGAIVQVSSLAGKAPVPYDSIYATTKAGLINFAESIRGELEGTGVTSSVVCPGFVADAGMWADRAAAGAKRPLALGTVAPQKVANAVVKAIKGHPELIVAALPMRPLLAAAELLPRLRVSVPRRLGLTKTMRQEAETLSVGEDLRQAARKRAEPDA
ncbi:MAG: SDR family NAD(P)-dependent oxidoreductase, partial [Dehalococcoidia bacterium]